MLGRLDEAFRQIRQFSADASHELQTPLTILKGELEVALRAPRTADEYRRVLGSALEESERIARLVEGLLLLSRADAGVLRMDRRPLDLARLVAEVCEQTQVLAKAQGVTVALGSLTPVAVQGDREHLRRLLLNLVDNGIKYTPAGGRVTLSLREDGAWAVLSVSDTGIGLAPGERERIFRRFYRAPEAVSRGDGGSGLGLCIARSIAEAHGGRIEVDSVQGQGSTFTVFLPRWLSPSPPPGWAFPAPLP
jgi:signal transduction histidine kinase